MAHKKLKILYLPNICSSKVTRSIRSPLTT